MKEPIEMRNLYEHETDAYNLEGPRLSMPSI